MSVLTYGFSRIEFLLKKDNSFGARTVLVACEIVRLQESRVTRNLWSGLLTLRTSGAPSLVKLVAQGHDLTFVGSISTRARLQTVEHDFDLY